MLDCEGSLNSVELIRSLSEMEPSGVSVEVTKSCTNKDHCQSEDCGGQIHVDAQRGGLRHDVSDLTLEAIEESCAFGEDCVLQKSRRKRDRDVYY